MEAVEQNKYDFTGCALALGFIFVTDAIVFGIGYIIVSWIF